MDMSLQIGAYVIALFGTVAVCVVLMILLHQPLRRFLLQASGSPDRTYLLTLIFQILVLLTPVVALTISVGFSWGAVERSLFLGVLFHLAWSGVGLIVAIFAVGIWALVVESNRSGIVTLRPDQVNDLQRLLAKVELLRAREIVLREPMASKPVPSELRESIECNETSAGGSASVG
jgi:hypothetical protein